MRLRVLPTATATLAVAALVPAGAALAAGSTAQAPSASASHSAHAARGAHAAVTWNGWRGVHFGESVRAAHRDLGGTYVRTSGGQGSCGDVLTLGTGTIDAKVGPHLRRVSDVAVKSSVRYPGGVRQGMGTAKVTKRLEARGYSMRTTTDDEYGTGDPTYLTTVAGPHGHTLYYSSYGKKMQIDRMGLALDRKVALQLMTINGC